MDTFKDTMKARDHQSETDLIRSDMTRYLKMHEEKELLRFLTCGSVDDGKSTLIGRLLFDCHTIYEDQLATVCKDSKIYGTTGGDFDPALLTDGLKAEREQGITIDVAYRYFSTSKRKFIIADTPGHEQYTRNMVTGASTCNLAVILIDARLGVTVQTKRHSYLCSLLGIRHVIVAINKMDLVSWSEERFAQIKEAYQSLLPQLGFGDVQFIPLAALTGDNVARHSGQMPWYSGPTILAHLETVNIATDRNYEDLRFPVQYVLRPDLNFRGFSGTLASGVLRKGDPVVSLPSQASSKVKAIYGPDGEIEEAFPPMAITITLEDEIDASRGTLFTSPENKPHVGQEFEAMLVWMHENPTHKGRSYLLKQTTNQLPSTLVAIREKVDVNTLNTHSEPESCQQLSLNEIARVKLMVHRPLMFDSYSRNHQTGSFILIDRISHATVGAGMILPPEPAVTREDPKKHARHITRVESLVTQEERECVVGQKGVTFWFTGLSGAGKSTLAKHLEKRLIEERRCCIVLDGDNLRHGLNQDLGFTMAERKENIRRVAEVARLFNDIGVIVLVALISPYREDRALARDIIGVERCFEVFVSTSLEICAERDPKGLYKKAREGTIKQFTGISDEYEVPECPDFSLDAGAHSIKELVSLLLAAISHA